MLLFNCRSRPIPDRITGCLFSLSVNLTAMPFQFASLALQGFSCASLCEVVQDMNHRLAGNPDQTAKWMVQFHD